MSNNIQDTDDIYWYLQENLRIDWRYAGDGHSGNKEIVLFLEGSEIDSVEMPSE